jgi:hypothetical protein
MHPGNIFSAYFPKIHSNINLPSTPRSSQLSLLFTFFDQNFVHISHILTRATCRTHPMLLPTHRKTRHRKTRIHVYASNGIRTHDPSVRVAEGSTCLIGTSTFIDINDNSDSGVINLPVWWPGNKNSPTVTHACRKRGLKWVATLPLGDINTKAWSSGMGVWAWG